MIERMKPYCVGQGIKTQNQIFIFQYLLNTVSLALIS